VNPIAQRLPIHSIGRCGLTARMAIQNHRHGQETANPRAVARLAGKPPKPTTRVVGPCDP
jgi:hypothetical protein